MLFIVSLKLSFLEILLYLAAVAEASRRVFCFRIS